MGDQPLHRHPDPIARLLLDPDAAAHYAAGYLRGTLNGTRGKIDRRRIAHVCQILERAVEAKRQANREDDEQ